MHSRNSNSAQDKEILFLWEEGPIWVEVDHHWRATVWVENEKYDAYGETWRVAVATATHWILNHLWSGPDAHP